MLPAGEYALEELRVGHGATVVVQGPVTLRVARELDLGNGVRVLATTNALSGGTNPGTIGRPSTIP